MTVNARNVKRRWGRGLLRVGRSEMRVAPRLAAPSPPAPLQRGKRGATRCWPFAFVLFAVAAVALGARSATAASPTVNLVQPCGGQRGTEVEVTFHGARLADAQEVLWYEPGIKVAGLAPSPKRPNVLKARLAIAAGAELGPHDFRLRTASGLSNLLTFSVGALKEVAEVEPNNDLEHAQKIALDTTVNGVIQFEDVDYYAVDLKKGERLAAEMEAVRLGLDFYDAHLAIINKNRFPLASSDNSTAAWKDALCQIVAPADDTYYIEARESAFGGGGRAHYRLHLGHFPRPRAVYPAGGQPGQTLEVRWLADVGGDWTQKLQLPIQAAGDFGRCAVDQRGTSPWPLPMRLSKLDNVLEAEPNDDPAHATPFTAPAALNGIIQKPGDVDCFRFTAKRGQTFDVRVYARALRSSLDSVLTVLRSRGQRVAENDDSNGPDSYLRLNCPADDEYTIQIRDHLKMGGPAYVYRIEVTPVEPQLTLELPEREAFEDIVAAVPQGNHTAFMVRAQREDFGGKIDLELKDLPKGIRAQALPMEDSQGSVPVVLSATEKAPLGGKLVDLIGRTAVNNTPLEGHLRQRTSLIRGQNNREVWNRYTQRMAVAVTQAVPFSLRVLETKAPLVQNGSFGLKVAVLRKPGFNEPVTLNMLYLPPGVSTNNSVTVAAGQREGIIPLTADGGAAAGTWKIAVLGTATVGDGPVTISSQLANLEITPPLFRFTFPVVNVDQGQSTDLTLAIEKIRDFKGRVKAELVGLPGEVTSQPQEFGPDDSEVTFPLQTSARSPAGKHKSLICKAVVMVAGEPVVHLLGTGEIRIQKALGNKTLAAAAPPPAAAKKAAAPQRLSRLEQLRQAQAGGKN